MATKKKTAKPVAKKIAPKKVGVKKVAVKPVKKTVPKKAVPKKAAKSVAKKAPVKKVVTKKAPVKKPVAKKIVVKKPVAKKIAANKPKFAPAKKTAKPIHKPIPVKKSAIPVVKKAAQKKLAPEKKLKSSAKSIAPPAKAVKESKSPVPKAPVGKEIPKAKNIKVPAPKPVALPKITTTKSRKYEPEFTRSVLDQAAPENNGPTQRYSDAELNEFRELIQRKLETAKKELGYLQGLITRKDEMGGDESDNRYMTMEDGSLSMEREQLSQMASRQITFIDHLEKAMMRIENKTYGICRVTGKLIDKARLRAVPHATLSIEAKMGQVR